MSIYNEIITPCYGLDLSKVKENYLLFKNCLDGFGRGNDIIAYSVKANSNIAVIEQLKDMGAYFEVCSEYEYSLMVTNKVNPKRVIVNGNVEIKKLHKWCMDGSLVILDSIEKLREFAELKVPLEIGIRINLDYCTKDERFRNKESRFGINVREKEFTDFLLNNPQLKIICLQCHLSGNNREPSIYIEVVKELLNVIERMSLKNIKYLDIGGGYKIANEFWEFKDYIEPISKYLKKHNTQKMCIIYEPGNSIVRNTAFYCTKVISEKNEKSIKVVDGSIIHLPRGNTRCFKYNPITSNVEIKEKKQLIVGSTCKESDIFVELQNYPLLVKGDFLVIEEMGAYSISCLSDFILKKPHIYVKNGDDLTGIIIQGRYFQKICNYSDCYRVGSENDYSALKKNKWIQENKGLYLFMNKEKEVMYVGVAYNRTLYNRIMQHFLDNDTGGLKYKLLKNKISNMTLNDCELYAYKFNRSKQEILFLEAQIVGEIKPIYNFL